jgi:hypothetical protein
VLLRGKIPTLGRGVRTEEIHDEGAESVRRLSRTPIYARDPLRNWTGVAETSSTDSVDCVPSEQLEAILRDGKFHEMAEVVVRLPFGTMLAAMRDLLGNGRAFDRVGDSLRLRARRPTETPQSLWSLVHGLDPFKQSDRGYDSRVEDSRVEDSRVEDSRVEDSRVEDSRVEDSREKVASSEPIESKADGLVLSDPPGDLTIPRAWLSSMVCAILAKRGSGKSYLGMVLVEEILQVANGPKVVVFDPTGAWWGLGAAANGGSPPHEVVILGGPRGHISLEVSDGGKVARIARQVDARAFVVDLSEMAPAEQHQVVADFCETLMGLPAFSVQVVIDEADEFAPQQCDGISEHQSRARGFVVKLVMRGRKKGIGATLISLRPAILSKNVLSQVDALFLLRMVESNDLRAIETWLENFEGGVSAEYRARCLGNLPLLPVGTAYYLRGGDEVTFRRFRTRRKHTFDSSRTPDGVVRPTIVLRSPRFEILEETKKILVETGRAEG